MNDVKKLSDSDAKNQLTADLVKHIFITVKSLDIDYIREFQKRLRDQFSKYEAIGIIDGAAYIAKSDSIKAKLNRINAVINLYDVLEHTNDRIIQGNEMDSVKEFFNQ